MAAQEQDLVDILGLNEAPELPQAEAPSAVPSGSPAPAPAPALRREVDLEELLAMEPEPAEEVEVNQLLAEDATSMYDWRTPAPDKQTYFNNKALIADLQKQGALPPKPGMMDMVGSMIETVADGINTMLWKYDPENEGLTSWQNMEDLASLMAPVPGMPAVNRRIMGIEDRPNTANPPLAISETVRRLPATLAMGAAWTDDFYKSLRDGIMANAPKYRVKETGEFVMPSIMGVGRQASFGGAGQNVYDIVADYKQQGKTLEVATETDLEDYEYEQFIGKREQNRALDEVLSGEGTVLGLQAPNRPEIVTEVLSKAAAGFADTAFGTKYLQALNAQQSLPMEGQSMVAQMFFDPGVLATGILAPARFGLSAAMKGATATTLEKTAAAARMVAGTADAAKKAKFVTRARRVGTILGSAGLANVMGTQSESDEVRQAVGALNAGLGLWGMVAGGGWLLRGYGKYGGKAAYLLRESAGPGNAIDRGARAAVAANPSVPLRYKDPLVRPSMYTAMESTPARLSKDMSLSPRARKLFGTLADWRAVQAVRGTSAAASGAVKGVLANVPFSEPLRAAGEEDTANLMLGLGAVLGAPLGIVGRVSGTAGRRAMAADSDVGRMLAEVQQLGETVPRKRANPDGEVMRALTETELAGGDVSAMMRNLSPDQLNEFAAVQGYFRDTTDFVPLNRADFEVNRKALNPNSADPIFLHAPDGERPRVFVNVEDAGSIKAGDLGRAFLKSESLPDRQVTAMINSVDTLYTPEQIAAREREIARAAVEQRYAKQGVKVGPDDPEVDLRLAMLRSQSQAEFGDANIWSRQAIAAEDLSNGIVDWNRMRRGLPKGNNPITHLESVLGAQARGLMISGVRIDPETGRPLDTPDSIKRTNPAAADDPAVAQGLKNYTEGYNKMRRDPANETPVTEPVSPERAAAIELSMTDAPMRARQIMDLAGGPDGPTLTPDNLSFGWRQEGNRRILAGRSLPDRVRYANHWKPHLEMIDTVQAAINDATPVAVRFDALGPSADVTKRPGPQYGATTREGVLVRWQATTGRKRENYKGGGELNVLLADMTTLRNRAINVLEAKHPTLDPSRGGPGYSLAAIMADAETYIANKGRNADPGTGLTPERLRVAKGLIEYGPDNVFGGLIDKDGIWRTPRLELIESVTPTGRTGHNMVGNNADGTFTQPPPKPMPDMGTDVAPAAPDAPAAAARDRIKRNLNSQSGALDVSILADLVDYGRSLYRAGMDAAVWTANMIKEFGERIRPLLKQAFDQVRNAYQASRFSDTTGAVNVTGMNEPRAAAAGAPFYMKSAQVLDSKIQGKAATADQVRAILKNPQNGIKAEELKWTGIEQAVERIAKENGGKVPKEALLKYLAEDGAVRLEEVRMGGARKQWTQADIDALERQAQRTRDFTEYERAVLEFEDQQLGSDANNTGNQTRFGQYQLPGGENYREVVLAMPVRREPGKATPFDKWIVEQPWYFAWESEGKNMDEAMRLYDEWRGRDALGTDKIDYKSSHFDTPNYVAHMRLNERTDTAGKPGLFLEEIQSDRHQAGREKGYATKAKPEKYSDGSGWGVRNEDGTLVGLYRSEADASRAAEVVGSHIPDAPFRKDWPVQMFKRALADAASSGKEWIGWTTGETQAARYDLSKQVASIAHNKVGDKYGVYAKGHNGETIIAKSYTAQELPDVVGKELSQKIIDGEGVSRQTEMANGDVISMKQLSGVDLKVGGEGMKGFYDQILPKEISKYVKQWGGQVEKARIGTKTSKRVDDLSDVELVQELERTSDTTPIWRVNITPQMRESIKKAGQALFVGGMAAVVAEQEQQ